MLLHVSCFQKLREGSCRFYALLNTGQTLPSKDSPKPDVSGARRIESRRPQDVEINVLLVLLIERTSWLSRFFQFSGPHGSIVHSAMWTSWLSEPVDWEDLLAYQSSWISDFVTHYLVYYLNFKKKFCFQFWTCFYIFFIMWTILSDTGFDRLLSFIKWYLQWLSNDNIFFCIMISFYRGKSFLTSTVKR